MELRALTSTGNGMTDKSYRDLEKDKKQLQNSDKFIQTGQQAIKLLNQGKTSEAKDLVNNLVKQEPANIHSYIQAGSLNWSAGDYQQAINMYKSARHIFPYYGLANNGLSVALKSYIQDQQKKVKTLNLDTINYRQTDMESLRKIFINYNDLPEKYQKVLTYSVFPLKNYLPVLAASGSTHYIIPLYEKSTDYKFGQEFKNQRSFDYRLWDDIRGRGGFNSATGIEDLHNSVYLDFNTLIHEFAHQVHGYAFTKGQKETIKQLYENAKKNKLFLDYYAGSNEYEYFAQGMEAYISTQGKLTLRATAKNTRDFLKSTDKSLYDYIEQIIARNDLQENYAASYSETANNFYYNGDYSNAEQYYNKALNIIPDYYDTLNSLGNMYRLIKSPGEAKVLHQKAVDKMPAKAEAYLNIGDDDFYITGSYLVSIGSYKKAVDLEPSNREALSRLASAYYQTGDLKESITNYRKLLVEDKNSEVAYFGMAYSYMLAGKTDKAKEYFRKALAADKNSADGHADYARLLIETGDNKAGEESINRALQIDKKNINVLSARSLLEYKKHNYDESLKFSEQVTQFAPENLLYKIRYAESNIKSLNFSNAKLILDEVAKSFSSNDLPRTVYNKERRAYVSYNVKNIPEKAEFYYVSGLLKEIQGDITGSVNDYQKSLEILPYFYKSYKSLKEVSVSNKLNISQANRLKDLMIRFEGQNNSLDNL